MSIGFILKALFPSLARYARGIYAFGLVRNRLTVLKHIIGIETNSDELIKYELSNGLKLLTYASRRNRTILLSVYEILLRKIYPIESMDLNVVLDLGAQIGVFSLFVACHTPARIYAFEPEPENFQTLKSNIELNGFQQKILPKPICIAASRGTTSFYINKSSSRSGGRFRDVNSSTDSIIVETLALADVLAEIEEEKIDLVKADIEGSEYDVFYSCPPNVLRRIQRIYIECHEFDHRPATHTLKEMRAFLERTGFNVVIGKDKSILYASQIDE